MAPKPTHKRIDWLGTRRAAETVACRECGSPPGHTCFNPHARSRPKLADRPAHLPRIEDTLNVVQSGR